MSPCARKLEGSYIDPQAGRTRLGEVRGHLRFGPPKTAAARRAVSVPSWLPDVIEQHLEDHPAGPDGLIFTAPEGGPFRRNTFRSRFWLPAVADPIGQPMRFHDLRHSHVALLIAEGAHPAVIASPPWATRVSRPSWTSTATSTKASTATPQTPSTHHGTHLMWTQCGRDARETGIKEGV